MRNILGLSNVSLESFEVLWFCFAEVVNATLQVFPGPGKLGRTIDLKKCESYAGLRRMLTSLFGLEGEFDDPSKGWQLIYTDHENDVLLVGDDPWE